LQCPATALLFELPDLAYHCVISTASVALTQMPPGNPSKGGSEASRRRSQRVVLKLAVTVCTVDSPKSIAFEEQTQTLVVNVHGALVLLSGLVTIGQKLRLINRATREEQLCRVAMLGSASGGKTQIGVEFLKPSPDFWHISFPPADWVVPEPSSVTSHQE
jgi:hypothetical protein